MSLSTELDKLIYFVVSIDTECDKGPGWLIQRPLQFRAVLEGIPKRLEPVFREFGARATYLLSPEVLRNDECVAILKDVNRDGAELGTHLHGEFIEPHTIFDTDGTWVMQNTYSREVEASKLDNLTQLFRYRFGYSPRCFRAGRFGIGRNTLPILSNLGYWVDSSVAPFAQWADKGGNVEFFGVPTQPYFPSEENYKVRGSLPILEVPVTTGNSWYDYLPQPILRAIPRYPRIWGRLIKRLGIKSKMKVCWLRPTFQSISFEDICRLMLSYLNRFKNDDVFFVMMFHNVDILPGCSPYAQNENEAKQLLERLAQILEFTQLHNAKFVTLSEIRCLFAGRQARPVCSDLDELVSHGY